MHRRSATTDGDEPPDTPPRGAIVHRARPPGAARTICLCADDFGLHRGVNEAALRLASSERVHAIACLVGGEGWSVAWVSALRRLDALGVDIGLHLDFTESPLLPRSRRHLPGLVADSLLGRVDAAHVRAEVRAQLHAFEQVLGHAPAFVDGHQHVHQLPTIRRELLDELADRYRGTRPWLRSTRPAGAPWSSSIKAGVIAMLGSGAFDAAARQKGFAQNRHLLGVYDFRGGAQRYLDRLRAWLLAAADGDLLMCHPGLRATSDDPLGAAREAECQVLASPAFGALLHRCGVALRPMSQILAHRFDQRA